MSTFALRTALIWHDEVMYDVVNEKPAPVTLGASARATFVTPPIGLPPEFRIIRPLSLGRGYVLTLAAQMSGTICVGGIEHDVAGLVRAGDDPEGFRSTAIGNADWGVVELDASGHYKLFFQFVPLDEPTWVLTRPVIRAGLAGYVIASIALAAVWSLAGVELGEAVVRGAGLSALALGAAALVRAIYKQDNESRASLAFSVMLHAALLFTTFQLYTHDDPFVWPGQRQLDGTTLITRIEATPTPVEAGPGVATPTIPSATIAEPARPAKPTERLQPPSKPHHGPKRGATKGDDPTNNPGGLLAHSDVIAGLIGRDVTTTTKKLDGVTGGPSGGDETPGTRGGTRGDGDGDDPSQRFRPKNGGIDTGPLRATVCVGSSCDGGGPVEIVLPPPPKDPDGPPPLTREEVDRVVRAGAGILRACYQRELNRIPSLGGKLVVHFVIGAEGSVSSTRIVEDSVNNAEVGSCVQRNIRAFRFPPKGGARVTYPFVFEPG